MVEKDTAIKTIGNETRLKILKSLATKDMHIAEIANELGISCTSISKHIRVLEDTNLISRNIFGKSHVLSLTKKNGKQIRSDYDLSEMELYILDNLFLI
ncbi:winged helix-turn-helix domain-containing protein [Methanolobus psychrotolerans]|uniref:winged helix-turn-helix domain-containing protein n=1 Tax=Methanolobus psychrotolerans TaxID=1874706 RepID=UPI0013EDF5C8|nr:winged helix-turn-helix domain-containing protein [Methanolobus psychrotolerans]